MKYFSPIAYNRMMAGRKKKDAVAGSSSCKCMAGHIHDSRGEAQYCTVLQLRQRAGKPFTVERQVMYSLAINGKRICGHRVDFVLEYPNGDKEVHEYKGFPTAEWDLKRKMFEALYPEIPYVVIRK